MEFVDERVQARWLYSRYLVSQRWVYELMVLAESSSRHVSRRNGELLRDGTPRPAMTAANPESSLHFVQDAAGRVRRFGALSVVDPYARECLKLEVDSNMGSRRVT